MANPLDLIRGTGLAGRITPPSGAAPAGGGSAAPGPRGKLDPRVQQAVITVAGQYGADPTLMLALLLQENAAQNPAAVGTSGEVGLFQILPDTALTYAQAPGNTPQERRANMTELLKDPHFNTQIAARHVKRMSDMFQNDPEKVFAAYNAGPTTVARAEADAAARGVPWQQSIQENRQARGVEPGAVGRYTASAGGLLAREGGMGARVPSTGAQRERLREVPPELPSAAVPPGIPSPSAQIPRMGLVPGAPPPVAEAAPPAPAPAPTPTPPVPEPPAPPPSPIPPRVTPPVATTPPPAPAPAPPPFDPRFPIQPSRMPFVPPAPLPTPEVGTPLPPKPISTPTLNIPPVPLAPPEVTTPAPGPVSQAAAIPDVTKTPGLVPPFASPEIQTFPEGLDIPERPFEAPGGVAFERMTQNQERLLRDQALMPPPSLGAVPQEVRTPELPPAGPASVLDDLTTEELLDLYQWLNQQGTGLPSAGGAAFPPQAPPYYHMGGMPAIMPQRPGFAEQARWIWEGGR